MSNRFGDWEVQIHNQPGYMKNVIYLWRRMPHGTEFLTRKGELVTKEEGSRNEDVYFAEMDDEQLQQLANAMAGHGVRTTNDSKNEGLLQATQAHLQDMRSIVFKNRKTTKDTLDV